jgi:hypothetical protein
MSVIQIDLRLMGEASMLALHARWRPSDMSAKAGSADARKTTYVERRYQ